MPGMPDLNIVPKVANERLGFEFEIIKNIQRITPKPMLVSKACFLLRLCIAPNGCERKMKSNVIATVIKYCGPKVYFNANLPTDAIKVPAIIEETADQRDIFLTMMPKNNGIATGTPVNPKKILVKVKTPY